MKSFCISTPGDVHEWLTAEARRRGCSVSHLLCTLAVREKEQWTIARLDKLEEQARILIQKTKHLASDGGGDAEAGR